MASTSKGKKRGGYGGRRNEDPDVRVSKTLSSILRHNARGEGLAIRPDGYVKLDELLRRPKLRGITFEKVKEVVETNDKQRFTMLFEPAHAASLAKGDNVSEVPVEIPHTGSITIPPPPGTEVALSLEELTNAEGTWYIRANQGHSIKQVAELELHEVQDASEIPIAIHGTTALAWNSIAKEGLSVMGRNHIHIAAGKARESGVISGMRKTSQILIYIDTAKAMADGIKFYISANGVILTEGNEKGFLLKEYFLKVERANGTLVPDSWST